jgi:alpha-N-acetylglucosamine transferase
MGLFGYHRTIPVTNLDHPLRRQLEASGLVHSTSRVTSRKCNTAIVSNVQNELYVPYALCLAHTIQKCNPGIADTSNLVLLVPNENDITPISLKRLERVGWKIRMEDDVAVPGTDDIPSTFRRNFIKLRIWSWTEYRKILFLDADVLVRGDISLLLSDGFGISFWDLC